MAKVIAMYGNPKDRAAFDRYYFEPHVPIARKVPGLRHYEITRGEIGTMAAVQVALTSAEGQATAADLANFADGDVQVYFAETASV